MRLLIDADQISTLADRFRGVSMQLLNTAQTVRNDAWSAELSSRDTKVKTATEVTSRVATKYEAHASSLDSQANELRQIESLVRGDHGDQAVLTAVAPNNWGTTPRIAPLQPLVTIPTPTIRSITDAMVPVDPMMVMPNAVAALQSIPNWITPTSSTVVQQVQAQLPEEMLPVKPKKKKGLFGRIFGAIGNFFKSLWNAVKKIAKKLWKTLETTLKGVWLALKNMSFKKLLLLAGTLALQFIPGLGQAAAGLIFGAANAARVVSIASAAYNVVNAGRAAYAVVTRGIHGIGDVFGIIGGVSGALGSIGTLGQSIGGVAARVGAFATRAAAGLASVTTAFSTAANSVLGAVSQGISTVLGRVGSFISSIVPRTGPLADVLRVIGRTAASVADWVKDTVKGVGRVITDVRDWVNKTVEDVRAKFQSVVDGLAGSIAQSNPAMGTFVRTLIDRKITEGVIKITTVWDDIRKIVDDGIREALAIVLPARALITGSPALIQGTLEAALRRTTLWTGPAPEVLAAVDETLTPVVDWTPTDPTTPETVLESVATDVTPSSSPEATTTASDGVESTTSTTSPTAPSTGTGEDNLQNIPEDRTTLAPVAELVTTNETLVPTTTDAIVDAVSPIGSATIEASTVIAGSSDTPSIPAVPTVDPANKLDCVMPPDPTLPPVVKDATPTVDPAGKLDCVMPPDPTQPPVVKDSFTDGSTKDQPLPRCVLPGNPKLPTAVATPIISDHRSGILPVNDPSALDALRNNLNVITPNGPIATAWLSPVSATQSSTMQGLLGLVDPTNEHSAMLRSLVAA
jgi:hypothetical protein